MAVRNTPKQRQRQESSTPEPEADEGGRGEQLELANPKRTMQHLFLQSLMARKIMTFTLATTVYNECIKLCAVDTDVELVDYLARLQEPLGLLGLSIKNARDQETGDTCIVLINDHSDGVAKLATDYSAVEIAFFRAVVEKIMNAADLSYSVSMTEASRCAKAPLTRQAGQLLLKSLLAKGWLTLHPSQHLTLSTRATAELQHYLKETYNDDEDESVDPRDRTIATCQRCFELVTSGWACPNSKCTVRLHDPCALGSIGANGKCPDHIKGADGCSQQWFLVPGEGRYIGVPVGLRARGQNLRADQDDSEDDAPTQKKGKKGKSSGKKSGGAAAKKGKGKGKKKSAEVEDDEDMLDDDEDEEEAEESDEDAAAAPAPARKERSQRATVKATKYANGDEDDEMSE